MLGREAGAGRLRVRGPPPPGAPPARLPRRAAPRRSTPPPPGKRALSGSRCSAAGGHGSRSEAGGIYEAGRPCPARWARGLRSAALRPARRGKAGWSRPVAAGMRGWRRNLALCLQRLPDEGRTRVRRGRTSLGPEGHRGTRVLHRARQDRGAHSRSGAGPLAATCLLLRAAHGAGAQGPRSLRARHPTFLRTPGLRRCAHPELAAAQVTKRLARMRVPAGIPQPQHCVASPPDCPSPYLLSARPAG